MRHHGQQSIRATASPVAEFVAYCGAGRRRVRRAVLSLTCRINEAPVIVLGNHKSGTSAIAALLALSAGATCAIDLIQEERRPTFDKVFKHEASFESLVRRNRVEFAQDIIKEPNLTVLAPMIRQRFPAARIILVVRDPRENVRSICNWLGWPGHLAQLPDRALGELSAVKRLVVTNTWLGLSDSHYITNLAERWSICARIAQDLDGVVVARYEDFLQDKAGFVEWLGGQVGLPSAHNVGTAADHQFQPAGRPAAWDGFFGDNLADLVECCREPMRFLGYDPRAAARSE